MLSVAVELGWTQPLDRRLLLATGELRSDWATPIMRAISILGSGAIEIPLALLLSYRLSVIRRRSEAAGYALATLSGWALYGLAKFAFQRPRPRLLSRLMRDAGWYSYPSGHAMLAPLVFGLGTLIWTAPWARRWRLALLGVAGIVSLLIGCSRIYVGAHWPTDVAGGLLLGTGWAAMWVWWWERAGRRV